ncbi:TerB N-terminal domain-containing protein [Tropicimonas sp. IMCC34043]|uniref:TerB N-terminal domain-containing protein n=1 Tax=Tropicimonas sp. IMCC34043 TaxID=2248760 RepID=UPI001E5DFF45|nr:TerB N-terminal domain-containing protein [Tropicimonas sp. IMCC34043]
MASSVSSRSTKSGWVPSSETASVAGRNIGGTVYVGTPPLLNTYGYRDKCRAYIDPSLSVARSGADKAGEGMPDWPGYSDILGGAGGGTGLRRSGRRRPPSGRPRS